MLQAIDVHSTSARTAVICAVPSVSELADELAVLNARISGAYAGETKQVIRWTSLTVGRCTESTRPATSNGLTLRDTTFERPVWPVFDNLLRAA